MNYKWILCFLEFLKLRWACLIALYGIYKCLLQMQLIFEKKAKIFVSLTPCCNPRYWKSKIWRDFHLHFVVMSITSIFVVRGCTKVYFGILRNWLCAHCFPHSQGMWETEEWNFGIQSWITRDKITPLSAITSKPSLEPERALKAKY